MYTCRCLKVTASEKSPLSLFFREIPIVLNKIIIDSCLRQTLAANNKVCYLLWMLSCHQSHLHEDNIR